MSNPTNPGDAAVPFGRTFEDEDDVPLDDGDPDEPVDEDLDADRIDSAEADVRASREGTKGDADSPG